MFIVRQIMLLFCTNARCIHHCIEMKKLKLHKEHSFLSIKKPVKLKSEDLSKRYCAALINSKALCAILFPFNISDLQYLSAYPIKVAKVTYFLQGH